MRIDLLGPLRVQVGDRECSITSRQARTLLALLALEPQRVLSVEWLMTALWEDGSSGSTRNALQAAVTRLRRHLRGRSGDLPLVKTSYGGYMLDVTPLDVDVFQFTSLTSRARGLRDSDPHEALRLYTAGLALWRGPALEGVSDLSALRAEQVRLDEGRLGALESSAELRLELGNRRGVLIDLRHLAEIHPDRERLSELLMVALYLEGQQREALDLFHRIRTRLGDEFGIDPGRGLRAVHAAILAHDPVLERPEGVRLLRSGGFEAVSSLRGA